MKPQEFSNNYWSSAKPVFYWSKYTNRWTFRGELSPETMDFIGYLNWVKK